MSPSINQDTLIEQVQREFLPRFTPDGALHYVSAPEWQRQNPEIIRDLGLTPQLRRRMPDVLIYQRALKRLVLIDASTSRGPITSDRRQELAQMYHGSSAELIYVTAFPTRGALAESGIEIAWGTLAWIADEPAHLIHFNGNRILEPHSVSSGLLR